MYPDFSSAFNDCRLAPVCIRRSWLDKHSNTHSSLSMADCIGERSFLLAARISASSTATDSFTISIVLSLTFLLPSSVNQSPAGSIARTASYTVQKKRSRINSASLICSALRTGSSSKTEIMDLSLAKSLCSLTARMIPSAFLFPREKGT